jgi:hypothetical protein
MALNNIDASVTVPSIDGWLNTLNDYASDAISAAGRTADSLNSFYPAPLIPEVTFDPIDVGASLGVATRPVKPTVNLGTRNPPSPPDITTPTVVLGTEPVFNEPDPSINLPTVPDPLNISLPVKDFTINYNYTYPVSPDTNLPDVPTLLSLSLPTLDTINVIDFNLDFPTSNSLVIPGMTFSFSESNYSDVLLTSVKDALITRLAGGTGLTPAVEAAIWNRGRDREQTASLQAERTLLVDRAQSGFSRPTGAAMAALDRVIADTQDKIIDLSRDIMIKQAELEQENVKHAIQQTVALEDILVREHMAINQRKFEVAKYVQDIQIELFKTAVTKYTSEVEAYRAFTQSYQLRVQAELNKVEIYKAKLDAEKLKGDINEQGIRLYIAQLDGIKTNVDIYKSLIQTVSEKIKNEGLKLEAYRTDIEAYGEAVKAKASEYTIYSEQIKGELAKVEVFDSKVKAFSSKIQAYAASSDVRIKKADIESNIQELNIKKYSADVEAFIQQVKADQLIYQSAIDIYKGESEIYLADISANRAQTDLVLKVADNTITQNKYKADLSMQNAGITLQSLIASYSATLEGKKAAGSIYSQIGASALSAINVSASVGGQVAMSASESHVYENR